MIHPCRYTSTGHEDPLDLLDLLKAQRSGPMSP